MPAFEKLIDPSAVGRFDILPARPVRLRSLFGICDATKAGTYGAVRFVEGPDLAEFVAVGGVRQTLLDPRGPAAESIRHDLPLVLDVEAQTGNGFADIEARIFGTYDEVHVPADILGGLLGHWRLDESSGVVAADSSGRGVDADLKNMVGNEWTAGKVGGALDLNGVDDYVEIPTLNANSNRMTFAAWVKGSGPSWTGMVFCKAGTTYAGLIMIGNRVSYSWNGDPATWGFFSGLSIPADVWSFIGLVLEPDKATLYLNEQRAVNVHAHAVDAFDAPTWIGRLATEYWDGLFDDVRIYDRALRPVDMAALYALGA